MSLTVKDLTKRYGDRTVVDRLSFGMPGPGVYALLGTNGAGKTTSIRMMLNMLSRDGGEVLWNGEPLDISRCNVGYLAEERGLYPKYALMDQLLYFAALRDVPRAEARRRIRYWAQRLEVEEYLYPSAPAQTGRRGLLGGSAQREKPKRPDQLSKGNQQKIQLMAALLSDPELLILDEPLSGLDPINTDLFKGIIREEIAAGKYLIMSSHQMATVEPIAHVGEPEKILLQRIQEEHLPCVLCINKIDTVEKKDDLLEVIAAYSAVYPGFDAIIPISARTGDGLEDLMAQLQTYAAEGPQLFPDGMTTDQPDAQVCAEIVREKLLLCLDKEIPHGTAVEVTRFTEREDTGIIDLDVTIYCEKASHKGIIIGKHGDMLKRISSLARRDIEKFMGAKVYMETWVKVKENWRDNVNFIRARGYDEQ